MLCDILRKRRLQRCKLQREVADDLHITRQQYQKYEYGIYIPKKIHLEQLAISLDVNLELLQNAAAEDRL